MSRTNRDAPLYYLDPRDFRKAAGIAFGRGIAKQKQRRERGEKLKSAAATRASKTSKPAGGIKTAY